MEASIITTYRCPMRCKMCNIWTNPSDIKKEFKPDLLKKLPKLVLVNLTGGEPFVREDLEEIILILFTKTDRVVISTSGWFEDRIVRMAQKFPNLGFRVSIEGLSQKNDELRGREGGFDRGLRILLGLRRMGIKDIGFGITVSNNNSSDMLHLYELSKNLKMQFATAAFHNSFYFHKDDNIITNIDEVCGNFEELINRLMKDNHPKSWFRAFFNLGLINYIRGNPRLLPCEAGTENFFIDPYGEVLPCNGMERKYWYASMGNLNEVSDFNEIWTSEKATEIREKVKQCPKNCWMIGSASPVMKKYVVKLLPWVINHKIKSITGHHIGTETFPNYGLTSIMKK
ncbi:radical SAM additional 4Fe4S-binding SPASM domain-containing protein [Syntrophus gentianae]|uniref:Radical SAM additional 4Fe4S-binding SPASM domain-containing protein n=1 Tax=Syntrophus gentianae TaxID=43775 RepID=A0A1H8BGW9_9BACT|nr:radical SAM protein [Syntrophus gentianae]SEM81374.1 radical SAM additional 4Fe4S-binding SPASM domain-containing protein [Syntrophus gentianae]